MSSSIVVYHIPVEIQCEQQPQQIRDIDISGDLALQICYTDIKKD